VWVRLSREVKAAETCGHLTVELVTGGGAASMIGDDVPATGATSFSLPWAVDAAVVAG
jgi:hypothetical protein